MKDFIFNVDTKILFGKDQMKNLASEIKKYGSRVLLAYGGGSICLLYTSDAADDLTTV